MGIFAVKKWSEVKWNELYVAIQILIWIRLFLFEEDGKPDLLDRRLQNKNNNNQPNRWINDETKERNSLVLKIYLCP